MSDGSGIITIYCQVLGYCVVIISKKCETYIMVIYRPTLCCYVIFVLNFYSVIIPMIYCRYVWNLICWLIIVLIYLWIFLHMLEFTNAAMVWSCVCTACSVQVWNSLAKEMIDTTNWVSYIMILIYNSNRLYGGQVISMATHHGLDGLW